MPLLMPLELQEAAARAAEAVAAAGVRLAVFDMDQTAVQAHSRGRLRRSELEDFVGRATADFVALVPRLVARGVAVAIATHSDEREFGGEVRPVSHILGEELAKAVLARHFEPQVAAGIAVVAYNPRARGAEGREERNLFKRFHMRALAARYNVSPGQMLFFDDTDAVVRDCVAHCGVRSFRVDPERGLRLPDVIAALREPLPPLPRQALL